LLFKCFVLIEESALLVVFAHFSLLLVFDYSLVVSLIQNYINLVVIFVTLRDTLLKRLDTSLDMAKAKTKGKAAEPLGKPQPVVSHFAEHRVITEDSDEARLFYSQGSYGKIVQKGKVQLSLLEALYLVDKDKLKVLDGRNREISFEQFLRKAKKAEPNFWVRYCVFKNMRSRGYIVKTALKFGADFRVYDRGVKPGEDHARWVIYPVHEGSVLTWYEFAAKNRVAHSTKKRLLLGIVDDEGDVTYYEVRWMRP